MISTALWISSDEARVFRFTPGKTETHTLRKHGVEHHGKTGANHPDSQDEGKFFGEVSDWMKKNAGDRILILGPGPAKTHFKDYVAKHSAGLVKQIIAVEAMEKGTNGEIEDFAHRHFKKVDGLQ